MLQPTWFDRLIDALAILAGSLMCLLVVLICADVAARSTRWFSLPWTLDAAEFALFLITFLGTPWVLREQGHIAIEIVIEKVGPATRRLLEKLANGTGLVICTVLVVYSVRQLLRSYASGNQVYETFVYPEWVQYAVPPPIFLMLMVLFVRRLRGHDRRSHDALGEGL